MQVRVEFEGEAEKNRGERTLTLPDGADVAALIAVLREETSAGGADLHGVAVCVNEEFVTPVHVLEEGDEVVVVPAGSSGFPR